MTMLDRARVRARPTLKDPARGNRVDVTSRIENARRVLCCARLSEGENLMAKGQVRPKTNNQPKLTVKQKKEKKKEKATTK